MRILILPILLLLSGCVTSPKEYIDGLNKLDSSQVISRDKIGSIPSSLLVKFQDRTKGFLEKTDPVFSIDDKAKERSFFKVYSFIAKAPDQVVEVHTQAYKPIGYGQVGIIHPYVVFIDPNGKEIKTNIKNVFFDYASTFMDGQYLRAAYELKQLTPNAEYRVLVGSKTSLTGEGMKSVTNYGAAGAGIFMMHSVKVSPAGPFWVYHTDQFKK